MSVLFKGMMIYIIWCPFWHQKKLAISGSRLPLIASGMHQTVGAEKALERRYDISRIPLSGRVPNEQDGINCRVQEPGYRLS